MNTTIRTGDGEYAFQGTNNNWYGRTITGKIRIARRPGAPTGTVVEFLLEEHGQTLPGVMNRYALTHSPTAKALLQKYSEIVLDRNWAEFDQGH